MPQRIDYDALAAQARQQGPTTPDYDALAAQARAEATAFARGKGRRIGPAPTLIDQAIETLPVVGGLAGLAAGGGWASVPLAALGAAGGEGLKQTIDALRGQPMPSAGQQLSRMAGIGAAQGALDAAGVSAAKALTKGSRWLMDAALRPGLRVVGKTGRPITGPGTTLSARFPTVNIVEETLQRKIPVRNTGLIRTQANLEHARQAAIDAVERAATARPRVAGLLPEGRVALPLGDIPVPAGGRPSLSPSHATERVPFDLQRSRQGMSAEPAVTQVYGGSPAATARPAVGDVVEGPGAVILPISRAGLAAPPAAPLLPRQSQMIGIEEQLEAALKLRRKMAETALPGDLRKFDNLIEEYRAARSTPADIRTVQRRKDVHAEAAARLYRTGKGTQKAHFQRALAKSERQAVEARLKDIHSKNAETQTQLALRETLLRALNREAMSGRWTPSGLIENPRFLGALAQGARRGASVAQWSPQAIRAAVLASLMASHGEIEK